MKRTTKALMLAVLGLAALSGCSPQQLTAADQAVGGTPLQPTTVPSTQPGGATVTVEPSTQQLTIHLVQDSVNAAVPIVSAVPGWGAIAAVGLTLLSSVLGVFAVKQTSAVNTANAVIAAAAPGVAQLVKQTTDNETLASDVTAIGQIAPGVINLLSHPAAAATASLVPAAVPAAH